MAKNEVKLIETLGVFKYRNFYSFVRIDKKKRELITEIEDYRVLGVVYIYDGIGELFAG